MEVINKRVQLAHGQIRKQTGLNQYTAEIGTIDSKNGFTWMGDVYNTDKTHLESFLKAFDAIPDMIHVIEKWNESNSIAELSGNHKEFEALMKAVSDKLEL